MPSARIREREPGVFQITVELGTDPTTGKRLQKFYTVRGGKRKAEREAARLLTAAQAGELVTPDKITVGEFLELWLEKYVQRHCRPKTIENYTYHLTKHVIPCLGHVKLAKLKTLQLEDYYADRQASGRLKGEGGLSAQSVLHHHRVLHEAFEHAIKWGYLLKNPAQHATPPRVNARDPQVLTEDESFLVIRAARDTRYYLPILLAVFMGLRRGEALGLRWPAIDWERKSLRVQEAYIQLDAGAEFGPTKTHRSKRPVTLPEFLIDALLEEKVAQEARKVEFPEVYKDQGLVCCKPDGEPWPPEPFGKGFSTWLKKLPVPSITFHKLRHSHISQALERGENLAVISSRVGHTSKAFTLDRYGHALTGADAGLAARLNERIQKGMNGGENGGELASSGPTPEPLCDTNGGGMEAKAGPDAKTAPGKGPKKLRIQARNLRRGRDSNSR